jgi:hypothetical protein
MRAEAHLVLVHGEVRDAAAELEEPLARVAVALVLQDGVLDGLFGQAVLELEGRNRQAVDEKPEVERKLRLVAAVTQLPRDAETIEWTGSSGPTGLSGVQGGSYDYRTFTTLSYFRGDWSLSLRWRHLPDRLPSARVTNPTSTTLSPGTYDIFDLSGGLAIRDTWSFRFGIDNPFDKQPPVTNANEFQTGSSTDTVFYDVLGRRGHLGFSISF